MGKPTGFLEYERKESACESPKERVKHYKEFHAPLSQEEQKKQAARCMECGVPFCQYGESIRGMTSGCPLHNLIPEWNDFIYHGNLEQAYVRLHKTSNFPEFTCRVCPALCEKACTCGLNGEPVSIRENERAVIEYAYANGLAVANPPKNRTGKKVAVIGSGPSGLAVADQLNQRGHSVTVYERQDRVGGLLRYGIPNMKLEKEVIDRKVQIMEEEGITFLVNQNVGKDVNAKDLVKQYDAVILACGASNPRDLKLEGREANGIHFAVDFLTSTTKALLNQTYDQGDYISAAKKDVVVVGGGDTGNDCVGTCIRQGCKSVLQLEMMPEPPKERLESNPWPEWPKVLKTDYGQEEAIALFGKDPRQYCTTVKKCLTDKKGNLKSIVIVELESKWDEKTGRMQMVEKSGSEKEIPCQLLLIAAGFLGSESYVTKAFGVEVNERTNVKTGVHAYQTSQKKVYAAGDMHTGQSLVVKAIHEGRLCAAEVDKDLMGYTFLQ